MVCSYHLIFIYDICIINLQTLTHWLAAPSWEKNAFHIAKAPLLILNLWMPRWQETLFSSRFTATRVRKEWKLNQYGNGYQPLTGAQAMGSDSSYQSIKALNCKSAGSQNQPFHSVYLLPFQRTTCQYRANPPRLQSPTPRSQMCKCSSTPLTLPALLCQGELFASENTPAFKPMPGEALKLHGTGAVITNLNLQSKLLRKASNITRLNMIKQFWEQDVHTHHILNTNALKCPRASCWVTWALGAETHPECPEWQT